MWKSWTLKPLVCLALATALTACGGDENTNSCDESSSTGLDKFAVAALDDQIGGAKESYNFDSSAVGSGIKRFGFQLSNTANALTSAPLTVTGISISETDGSGKAVDKPSFRCEMLDGSPCTAAAFPPLIPTGNVACAPADAKTGMSFDIIFDGSAATSSRKAKVTIKLSGDPKTPSITVDFATTQGEARLACDPKDINFGTVAAGNKPLTETVKCRSIGSAPVEINKIELFSTTQPPITVAVAGVTDPVSLDAAYSGTPPLAVKPGQSLELKVQLGSLPAEDQVGATLQVSSNDSTGAKKVFISANSSGPCLKPSPNTVSFGDVPLGQPSKVEVLLDSCGTEPVTVESIALKAASAGDLQLDFNTGSFVDSVAPTKEQPLVIQPNGQESFRVVCTPSTLGTEAVGTVVLKTKEAARARGPGDLYAGQATVPRGLHRPGPTCADRRAADPSDPEREVQQSRRRSCDRQIHLVGQPARRVARHPQAQQQGQDGDLPAQRRR